MKTKNIGTFLFIAAMLFTRASAESRVVLSRAGAPLETTIPGEFRSLEAILPALFTLADQAADKSAEQAFIRTVYGISPGLFTLLVLTASLAFSFVLVVVIVASK